MVLICNITKKKETTQGVIFIFLNKNINSKREYFLLFLHYDNNHHRHTHHRHHG